MKKTILLIDAGYLHPVLREKMKYVSKVNIQVIIAQLIKRPFNARFNYAC